MEYQAVTIHLQDHHIEGEKNPADYGSRYIDFEDDCEDYVVVQNYQKEKLFGIRDKYLRREVLPHCQSATIVLKKCDAKLNSKHRRRWCREEGSQERS